MRNVSGMQRGAWDAVRVLESFIGVQLAFAEAELHVATLFLRR
jgi:hypothetical protein